MLGGRKVRSNKGKKRGSYRTKKTHHNIKIKVNSNGNRKVSRRKTRSNKGKKRTPYGPRTGKTRSGRKFRGGIGAVSTMANVKDKIYVPIYANPCGAIVQGNPGFDAQATPEVCRSRMEQQWATTYDTNKDKFNALDIDTRGRYYNGTGIDLEKQNPVFTPAYSCESISGCSTDPSLLNVEASQ